MSGDYSFVKDASSRVVVELLTRDWWQVLMRATDMLVCGEDLGMIPACVPPVMQQLGLVGARRCPRHCAFHAASRHGR